MKGLAWPVHNSKEDNGALHMAPQPMATRRAPLTRNNPEPPMKTPRLPITFLALALAAGSPLWAKSPVANPAPASQKSGTATPVKNPKETAPEVRKAQAATAPAPGKGAPATQTATPPPAKATAKATAPASAAITPTPARTPPASAAVQPAPKRVTPLMEVDLAQFRQRSGQAHLYYIQAKYPQAERAYREALTPLPPGMTDGHYDAMKSRHELAETLRLQKKLLEAEAENTSVLVNAKRVLGSQHTLTLLARHTQAQILMDQGRYPEAERELRILVEVAQKIVGRDGDATLTFRSTLGQCLRMQGRLPEAEREFRVVLESRLRSTGPLDPHLAQARYDLAVALKDQRKDAEARDYAQQAYAGWKRTMPKNHPDIKKGKALVSSL